MKKSNCKINNNRISQVLKKINKTKKIKNKIKIYNNKNLKPIHK